jgi:hypothetical protein
VLPYLVKSKTRRRLLALLWGEGRRGSVGELAALAGVAFGSAYRELHEMLRYQLVATEVVDGVEVFAADMSHPGAELMRQLAQSSPRMVVPRGEESDRLRRRLSALGVPLAVEPLDVDPADRVATLVEGVQLARRDPVLARVLPLGFWHQRDELDGEAVVAAARAAREKRAVGFVLDLTSELSGDPRFRRWARRLVDRRVRSELDFFELPPTTSGASRPAPDLAVARRWHYRVNMDLPAFKSQFDKFAHVA